jgi:hypothetical protein
VSSFSQASKTVGLLKYSVLAIASMTSKLKSTPPVFSTLQLALSMTITIVAMKMKPKIAASNRTINGSTSSKNSRLRIMSRPVIRIISKP